MPREIIVAEDLTAASEGADEAASKRARAVRAIAGELARRLRAGLHLVHANHPALQLQSPETPLFEPLRRELTRRRREELEAIPAPEGVKTKRSLLETSPVEGILAFSERRRKAGAELLVTGTAGRTGVPRALLGSVAEEVVRLAKLPVLVVGPHAQRADWKLAERPRIVVATDLTRASRRAETYAFELARRLGGSIVYYHSLSNALHPAVRSALALTEGQRRLHQVVEDLREGARRGLQRRLAVCKRYGIEAAAELDEGTRSVDAAVVELARREGALIVQGTHARGAVMRAFLGSTARAVIQTATVPVIVVK